MVQTESLFYISFQASLPIFVFAPFWVCYFLRRVIFHYIKHSLNYSLFWLSFGTMYDCVERSAIVLFSIDFCVNISFINGLFLYHIEFPRSFSLNLMKIMDLTNVIKFSARNMAVTMVWWLVHLHSFRNRALVPLRFCCDHSSRNKHDKSMVCQSYQQRKSVVEI